MLGFKALRCFPGNIFSILPFTFFLMFSSISQQISQEISSEGQISADEELSVEDLMKKLKSI